MTTSNQPEARPVNRNRSALWAIVGVIVGFSLPLMACIGLTLIFSFSLAAVGNQPTPTNYVTSHLSGPLAGPSVAVIDISGTIVSGGTSPFATTGMAASGDIVPLIQAAARDSDVRAIVLSVNSPGGSVVPSDEIYHELQNLRIPIVVLMGDVAASGAYYLSMAADHIIANPNTLTGSIGVISTFPHAYDLLEKVGIEFTVITSGEVKDFGSPYRPMTTDENTYWQGLINEVYEGFVDVVAEGRAMDPEEVLELADGRVYSGQRAVELGLIDALGYQEDAIEKAADLGGISGEPRVIQYQRYSPLASFLGQSISSISPSLPMDLLERALSPAVEYRWVP